MGKLKFKKEHVNIEQIVNSTVEELKHEAETKGISLNIIKSENSLPEVIGEADRIKEVLINLVGNAIKFTEKGGVTLSFKANPGSLSILIRDTGRGISEANQTLLFHKFQQANSSLLTRDTSKGTGLGLYISKLMAEGMGGSVTLVNSQEGKGSTFAFSLLV
jgi:signal transduction histidine kinase